MTMSVEVQRALHTVIQRGEGQLGDLIIVVNIYFAEQKKPKKESEEAVDGI